MQKTKFSSGLGIQSFSNEGVWIESAFLKEENGAYFLIYFMRAVDAEQAIAIFQNSSLAIDHFHRQCWEKFTEGHEILSPIFHLESEQLSLREL